MDRANLFSIRGSGKSYLEKLLQLNDRDELLLHNLSRAYFSTGETNSGERVLDMLKYNFPKSRFISPLESLKEGL